MITFTPTYWLVSRVRGDHHMGDFVGFIPEFFSEDNPASAKEQIHRAYAHGGGWNPFQGFKMSDDKMRIMYPGDPAFNAIATARMRDETIILYEHEWLAIIQPDGSHEIARID